MLAYKELARLHSAHGWSWLDQWVSGGRFRPVYVVGGVVSGRWASRGGGALQIPRTLRICVRAEPGWKLVVADAAQVELRQRLADRAPEGELVFFQHDEVTVHCPADYADVVGAELARCAREAALLVFGHHCPVRFPLQADAVDCYADAK